MRSLIGIKDFSVKELQELIERASDIIDHPEMYSRACSGKTLATLFFEPSTRTRLSFEAAMYGLGGNVLGFQSGENSSASKGESVADTAKVISGYADIIAMRHPKEGAPMVAALNAEIPVINAGDGGHQHPTQTLTDLLTIYRKKGRLDNLVVGFCGDLKYGRTVHSLIEALARYSGIRFVLISPEELRLPGYVREETLKRENLPYVETASLEEALPELDILYMTRIQRERFSDLDTYERLKDAYVLDVAKMALAKKDLCVMHPLPRVNEISVAVDADPRASYFEQAKNGKFIRMALILMLLEEAEKDKANRMLSLVEGLPNAQKKCNNPNCISHTEQELPMLFQAKPDLKGRHRCFWCESREDLLP